MAWEFYGEGRATIVYDGVDICRQYGLDAAYRPYELGGKLIFIGKREDRYVIMYDGHPVAPEFDEITIGYCCETVLYSPRFAEGRYLFWGRRDGRMRVVEITAADGVDRQSERDAVIHCM